MKKSEFLRQLRELLSFELPKQMVDKNVSYYRDYIEEEVKKGKSETDVIGEIGDPQLIARTIIDAALSGADGIPGSGDDIDYKGEIFGNKKSGTAKGDGYAQGADKDPEQNRRYKETGEDSYQNSNENRFGRRTNIPGGWYFYNVGCLGPILAVVFFFLIFSFFRGIINIFGPVLIPLCMVLLILWLLSRRE